MTEDRRGAGIDLDDDPDFERRDRQLTRVGWILLTAFVLAAFVGLLGPGPLSARTPTSADGALGLEYHAIGHIEADDSMSVLLDGSTVEGGTVTVEMTGSWFAGVDIATVSPTPAAELLVPGGAVLQFDVERPGDLEVVLHFRAEELGPLELTVESGDSSLTVSQFILP